MKKVEIIEAIRTLDIFGIVTTFYEYEDGSFKGFVNSEFGMSLPAYKKYELLEILEHVKAYYFKNGLFNSTVSTVYNLIFDEDLIEIKFGLDDFYKVYKTQEEFEEIVKNLA